MGSKVLGPVRRILGRILWLCTSKDSGKHPEDEKDLLLLLGLLLLVLACLSQIGG